MARFYSVKQAALILGFSTNSIYKFLDEGRLKGIRGNAEQGRFKISHTNLEAFLKIKLPEDALAAAVEKHQKQLNKKGITQDQIAATPLIEVGPETSSDAPVTGRLPQKLARILIVVALIGILADLIINQNYSLSQNGIRLLLLTILILLTYQYGGVNLSK